jgi:aspartyl-tRNA(Asn)/glutamyl-tRNA(Gln) amidotransferase subunit A
MTDIFSDLTIIRAQELFSTGELTSVALVKHFLQIIDAREADVHAYREVFGDVLEQAERADALRHDITNTHGGDIRAWIQTHPLLGMPISIKDNILIKGRIAGASSKILEDYVAPYDATVITKLKNAGAIFIGRVNMDEFAMGGSTENSAYGPTRNPHDSTRVAGGSSGGSIASVVMDAALTSLGSDTGGSIRQPAAYCGVVGLKPTYGSVSRHGLMAMGSSLDVIGPVTRSVDDAELLFSIIKGKDIHDGTSHDNEVNAGVSEQSASSMTSAQSASPAAAPLVVGIIPELMNMGGIDSAVLENFNATINKLREQGVEVREISLPRISYSLATYYIVMPAEVSSNMGRFDGIKYGNHIEGDSLLADYMNTRGHLLGKEVRRRIILGAYVLSAGYYDAYYNRANSVRELLKADFNTAFESVSVIATPTAPTPAFKIGANTSDPVKMYLEDVFTVPANLVGIPAISVPTGHVDVTHPQDAGLPLAIQFMASHGHESLLFDISRMIESKRKA